MIPNKYSSYLNTQNSTDNNQCLQYRVLYLATVYGILEIKVVKGYFFLIRLGQGSDDGFSDCCNCIIMWIKKIFTDI